MQAEIKSETPHAKSLRTATVSHEAAVGLIDAALAAAKDLGIEVSIAVTDAAGHLKAFERTDHARFLTIEIAVNKAWTVASFGLASHVWNSILTTKPEITQLAHIPRLMAVGGGCPVLENGVLIGAIGVSGGNVVQDRQIAEVALKALGFEVPAA